MAFYSVVSDRESGSESVPLEESTQVLWLSRGDQWGLNRTIRP